MIPSVPEVITKSAPGNCQLCGCEKLTKFEVIDRTTLWVCTECDLYQYGKVADSYAYQKQYHSKYQSGRARKIKTGVVRLNRAATYLKSVKAPVKMLDIGCSIGCTLAAAEQMGWEATGVDVSVDAVKSCKESDLNAIRTDSHILPFEDNVFDVVVSWHVIEHVESVSQTLQEWQRVLKPGGLMVLETPDASSPKVKRKGTKYRRFWAPEHTYTFAPKHLSKFMENVGLQIVPLPFIGPLKGNQLSKIIYSMVYQSCTNLRHWLGHHKSFQLFAIKRI